MKTQTKEPNVSLWIGRNGAVELANSLAHASEATDEDLRASPLRLARQQLKQIAAILEVVE